MKTNNPGLDWYRSLDFENDIDLLEIDAKDDVAVAIEHILSDKGMSRKDFAKELGKSQPYVTKVLSGDANLTIGSLVRIAHALGRKVEVHFADPSTRAFSQSIIKDGAEVFDRQVDKGAAGWAAWMRRGAANTDQVMGLYEQSATA